jgi:CRP-like cAMP-binding protein
VLDEEVVTALVELLRDEKYFSADIKNQLLVSVCEILGRSGSVQAQKALLEFTGKTKVRPKRIAEPVWQAAQKGLTLLDSYRRLQKQGLAEAQKKTKGLIQQARTVRERPVYAYTPVTELVEEKEVYSLLDQHRLVEARKRLLHLIITLSYLHQLDQAEILRQRLLEIDPLALEDALYASELIGEQRDAGAGGQGVSWSEVYDCLSTEEFNNLYTTMMPVHFAPDMSLATQGVVQQQLFFINKGRVKLFHRDAQGNDILLQIVGPGGVVGTESFFKNSVWTVSAASIGMVDALALSREGLQKWKTLHPDLESKMEKFCQQSDENDSSKMMAVERRQQERWNFSGQLAMTLFDDKGGAVGPDLLSESGDISVGGACCLVRVAQNRSLNILLGRRVRIRLPELAGVNTVLAAGKIGVVVSLFRQTDAVVEVDGQESFSVHIQFDQVLQESDLAGVQIVS